MKQPPPNATLDRKRFEASFPLLIDSRAEGDSVVEVYDTLVGVVVRTVENGVETLEKAAFSRRDVPKRAPR